MDSTLFLYFLSLRVLKACYIPAKIEVPPRPDNVPMASWIFWILEGVTLSRGINREAKLSNVIKEIRSDSPRSSTMYESDFLTSSIFVPLILPLTSITHIKSIPGLDFSPLAVSFNPSCFLVSDRIDTIVGITCYSLDFNLIIFWDDLTSIFRSFRSSY